VIQVPSKEDVSKYHPGSDADRFNDITPVEKQFFQTATAFPPSISATEFSLGLAKERSFRVPAVVSPGTELSEGAPSFQVVEEDGRQMESAVKLRPASDVDKAIKEMSRELGDNSETCFAFERS